LLPFHAEVLRQEQPLNEFLLRRFAKSIEEISEAFS
jgi:hypothetical protein